jgi:hypothetical protein
MNDLEPGQLVRIGTTRLWLDQRLIPVEIPEDSVGMILGFKKVSDITEAWVTYTVKVLFNEQVILTQGLKTDIESILQPVENT